MSCIFDIYSFIKYKIIERIGLDYVTIQEELSSVIIEMWRSCNAYIFVLIPSFSELYYESIQCLGYFQE